MIRRHGSALVFPVVASLLISFLYFFVDSWLSEPWQHQALLATAIILGLFFWLIPSVKFFTNRYSLTPNDLTLHSGLFGTKKEILGWNEITAANVTRGVTAWLQGAGDIRLQREFGQDIILKRVPRAKKLLKELEQHLVKVNGSSGMRK